MMDRAKPAVNLRRNRTITLGTRNLPDGPPGLPASSRLFRPWDVMKQLFSDLRAQTRWQIYGRVVPVLAVAAVATAVVAWLGYGQWAQQTASERQSRDLRNLAVVVRERAAFTATALEAARLRQDQAERARSLAAGASALGVVERQGRGHDAGSRCTLAAAIDTPANRERLGAWHRAGAADPHRGDVSRVTVHGVAELESQPGIEVLIFAPMSLADARTGGTDHIAVLPVAVRSVALDGQVEEPSLVALLDLGELLPELDPDLAWWCVTAPDGEVVLAADASLQPGTRLGDPVDARAHCGPGLAVSTVSSLALTTDLREQRTTGAVLDPWIVGRYRDPGLPLVLIAAGPVHRSHALAIVCFSAVLAIVLLALIVALVGLSTVVGSVSVRLTALGANMEALARGDYTRRMPRGNADEVGRLVTYFNLMAASLEEAHRQVKDKAAHLKAALENMRMLDRAKDDFLVLISHEVRTPLTAVLGGVKLMKSSIDTAGPEDKEVLERLNFREIADIIASSGERLNGFMTDAIQMTTIQSGDRRLELAPVAPADLLAAGLQRVTPWALNRGITVENHLPTDLPWQVLCDRGVLQVAIQKILDNAVAHNLDGGKVVVREADEVPGFGDAESLATAEQVHRLHEQPGWLEWSDEDLQWRLIEIHNTGRAIPRSRIDALFGKFELVGRIDNHSRGSGLSLPIAKAAIEQHGGRILVHSQEGWGTAFYLLVPTMGAPTAATRVGHLWGDAAQGVGRGSGHEEIDQVGDAAGFEVELDARRRPALRATWTRPAAG